MSQLDTLAKIFTLTYQGLGSPTYLDLLEVKRAVHEACALYWTDLIQSDENQMVKASASFPFVNNQYVYSLASITDMVMPDWVEVQYSSDVTNNWQLATTVNRDSLPMYLDRPELACAFYGDVQDGTRYIEWSYVPYPQTPSTRNFRIWYDPTIHINTADGDATGFPVEYNYILAIEARLSLIPIMQGLIVNNAEQDKTPEAIWKAKIGVLDKLEAKLLDDRVKWDKKWKFFKNASRANQGGGSKQHINPQYL